MFLPGESHGQRSLAGYSPWGPRELDTWEIECARTHTHTHTELARQHALLRCWIPSSRGTLSPGRWMVIPIASLLSPLTHRQLLPLLSALVISLCEISSSFFYLSFPDWTPTDTIPSVASCNLRATQLFLYKDMERLNWKRKGKLESFVPSVAQPTSSSSLNFEFISVWTCPIWFFNMYTT